MVPGESGLPATCPGTVWLWGQGWRSASRPPAHTRPVTATAPIRHRASSLSSHPLRKCSPLQTPRPFSRSVGLEMRGLVQCEVGASPAALDVGLEGLPAGLVCSHLSVLLPQASVQPVCAQLGV